jgi:hypothetical protein
MSVLALCVLTAGVSARDQSALQPVRHIHEPCIEYIGRSYHHIGSVRPKAHNLCRLPEPSLRAIALHRVAYSLSCNHTQLRFRILADCLENGDSPRAPTRPRTVDRAKTRPGFECAVGSHSMRRACDGPWYDDASAASAPRGCVCGRGSRACAFGGGYWVDMFASY